MKILLVLWCFFLFAPSYVLGAWVPGDYGTISAAIAASNDGDTIYLSDGTYTGAGNLNLDYAGKAITIRSQSNNPELCIIDCEGSSRGLYFHNGENATSVFSGITIKNGSFSYGGGLYCSGSGPTIENCIFDNNYASSHGGGMRLMSNSNITLINCIIKNNSTVGVGGGLSLHTGSSATIRNCVFDSNIAATGGAIRVNGSTAIITNSTIVNNIATTGGGVANTGVTTTTITNSILWGNTTNQLDGSDFVVTYSNIENGYSGHGNINNDSFFAPDGYHLLMDSPCRNSGIAIANIHDQPLPVRDIDNEKVMSDNSTSFPDIGCDEFHVKSIGAAIPKIIKGGNLLKILH